MALITYQKAEATGYLEKEKYNKMQMPISWHIGSS